MRSTILLSKHFVFVDPGPLITAYPHAGILNTAAFLVKRYPTTATNRNRARSRWTYYHFLGLDIEKSASRTTDPVALADTNNPTMHQPGLHGLPPRSRSGGRRVSELWRRWSLYKDQWGGIRFSGRTCTRKRKVPNSRSGANPRVGRTRCPGPVSLAAGTETLRVMFTTDYYDGSTGVDLDRLDVKDGRPVAAYSSAREFERMQPPDCSPWWSWGTTPVPGKGAMTTYSSGLAVIDCALFMDVRSSPPTGVYRVDVVAWSGRHFVQWTRR